MKTLTWMARVRIEIKDGLDEMIEVKPWMAMKKNVDKGEVG